MRGDVGREAWTAKGHEKGKKGTEKGINKEKKNIKGEEVFLQRIWYIFFDWLQMLRRICVHWWVHTRFIERGLRSAGKVKVVSN